jgi:hypothetical protein
LGTKRVSWVRPLLHFACWPNRNDGSLPTSLFLSSVHRAIHNQIGFADHRNPSGSPASRPADSPGPASQDRSYNRGFGVYTAVLSVALFHLELVRTRKMNWVNTDEWF